MLYLCATPIGNLGDLTPRAAEAFAQCDAVFCEDTRRTRQLLTHLGVKKPLVSCHAHNEKARAQELVALLAEGKSVCYASDAGMPGISDPGAALVSACIDNGLPFTVLPGASAVLTAAVLSGLPCGRFTFFGFFPRESAARRATLAALSACPHLALVYESPQRVPATLRLMYKTLGDRPAAVLRELTKLHETAERGTLSELCERFPEPPRGECVIAVLGAPAAPAAAPEAIDEALRSALAQGCSVRDAAKLASDALGVAKKDAYARALTLRGK